MTSNDVDKDSYSALFAFVYTFNIIVGIGALTLPKAFNNSGLLLGIILLVILCFVSYVTSTFVIEAMAAANAYHRLEKREKVSQQVNRTSSDSVDSLSNESMNSDMHSRKLMKKPSINASSGGYDNSEVTPLVPTSKDKVLEDVTDSFTLGGVDDYEISEKFELGSMANMFFPTFGVVLYYIVVCLYLFGDLTIYAVTTPISITKVVCDLVSYYAYNETVIVPEGNCSTDDNITYIDDQCIGELTKLHMYYIFLALFFLLVGPFCFLNMTKTKILQIITTIMRYLAFALMVIVAIVRIADGKINTPTIANFKNLPNLFGISVYSFMCQHSLPGMVTPMRGKKWVYLMLAGDFATTLLFYLLLTITGSFAFKSCNMRELYTLDFFRPGDGTFLLIIGTYLALFPVFTLSTNFPIIAVTLRENLKSLARLVLKLLKIEKDIPKLVNIFLFPILALIPPLIISYATQQDDLLVSITGSFPGVGVQYVIPAALVLMGRYTLKKKFGSYDNKYKSPVSHFILVGVILAWSFASVVLIIVKTSLDPPEINPHPIT